MATKADLSERIIELENALDGWNKLGADYDTQFSRSGLREISRLARLFYLKNPLINRGVTVKADYIWGRGININAPDPDLNAFIQAFLDDKQNKRELFAHQARLQKEVELQVDGNLFLAIFIQPATGQLRISSIPATEISEIITNPDNRKENWYYKREFAYQQVNFAQGTITTASKTVYYRDYQYFDESIQTIGGHSIDQAVIYHIKVGGFSDWTFGVSELYSALDWAKAYTELLSNFASIVRALARYAWQVKAKGGARSIAAAKTKLGTTLSVDTTERNPPSVTGSSVISETGDIINPVKTAGSTTPPDEARPIKLMVAAAQGLPETFYGDADVGNHATAKTLDRPTELGFTNRQELWKSIYRDLIDYAVFCSVRAPAGELSTYGSVVTNAYGEPVIRFDDPASATYTVSFPPLLERDTESYIKAIISAFTLDGKQLAPFYRDPKYIVQTLLSGLGETDVDEILTKLFPEGETEPGLDANPSAVEEALRALTETLQTHNDANRTSNV